MNQEKFGKLIKEIRKENNFTQKEFADKYNVTYQAVSKWENGLNMPDTSVIAQICKDYNLDMENLLEGKKNTGKKSYRTLMIIIVILSLLFASFLIIFFTKDNDFNFSTLSTSCNDFQISGSISYNEKKSAIYISSVDYCGKKDNNKYSTISCALYEKSGNTEIKISACEEKNNVTLNDFLKNVSFNVGNYAKACKDYSNNSLYLKIETVDDDNKTTSYKVPLELKKC